MSEYPPLNKTIKKHLVKKVFSLTVEYYTCIDYSASDLLDERSRYANDLDRHSEVTDICCVLARYAYKYAHKRPVDVNIVYDILKTLGYTLK